MKESDYRKISDTVIDVYVINEEDDTERKYFRIDKEKKQILFYSYILLNSL